MLTIRYFAGARAAAGRGEEHVGGSTAVTLEELAHDLTERHGPRLGNVLQVASFLVDGTLWRDRREPLPADATVDVLPPFAGG